jgi:hypothetical protein
MYIPRFTTLVFAVTQLALANEARCPDGHMPELCSLYLAKYGYNYG